jgi:hypothetical protein
MGCLVPNVPLRSALVTKGRCGSCLAALNIPRKLRLLVERRVIEAFGLVIVADCSAAEEH